MTALNFYKRVAEVAVRVAVKTTTATHKNPYISRLSGHWVAEVAALSTSLAILKYRVGKNGKCIQGL